MDPVKSEIDLRPPEFTQARRGLRRRFILRLIFFAAVVSVLLLFFWAERNLSRISGDLFELRRLNQTLAKEAAPLLQLETWILSLEDKAVVQASLRKTARPWSAYLRQIKAALPQGFYLTAFKADVTGQLTFYGAGPSLPQIALYNQTLIDMAFIAHSAVSKIDLNPEEGYSFIIQAALEDGAYLQQEDKP